MLLCLCLICAHHLPPWTKTQAHQHDDSAFPRFPVPPALELKEASTNQYNGAGYTNEEGDQILLHSSKFYSLGGAWLNLLVCCPGNHQTNRCLKEKKRKEKKKKGEFFRAVLSVSNPISASLSPKSARYHLRISDIYPESSNLLMLKIGK
jgi:hypothetical protein